MDLWWCALNRNHMTLLHANTQVTKPSPLRLVVYFHLLLVLSAQVAFCQYKSGTGSCTGCDQAHINVSSSGKDGAGCIGTNPTNPCQSLQYTLSSVHQCAEITILDSQNISSLVVMQNSEDLVIMGAPGSLIYIYCENESGISIVSSRCIRFENIHFVSCAAKYNYSTGNTYTHYLIEYAAAYFYRGSDIQIVGCSFSNGTGTGVIMYDVIGTINFKGSNFTANRPIANSIPARNSTSGGLIIKNVNSFQDKFIIYSINTCVFTENENNNQSGLAGGVTLYLSTPGIHSSVYISGSSFTKNQGDKGGGVHVYQNGSGSNVSVKVSGGSLFDSNHASTGGGMLLTQISKASMINLTLESDILFQKNSAIWGGGLAVYSEEGHIRVDAYDSAWIGNNAEESGFGVGCSAKQNAETSLEIHFYRCQILFNTNMGYYNEPLSAMGAVQISSSKAEFYETDFFSNDGIALHVKDSSYASFWGSVRFIGNTGLCGAAIYVDQNSLIALKDDAHVSLLFHRNIAIHSGGAIYTEPSILTTPPCVFASFPDSEMVMLNFSNNLAANENISIFVGTASNCLTKSNSGSVTNKLFGTMFTYDPKNTRQVSSNARQFSFNTTAGEVMLGEQFYLVPNATDVFGNSAILSGTLRLILENESYTQRLTYENISYNLELVGPSLMSMDKFTHNMELYVKGSQNLTNNTKLYLEFIYKFESDYHDHSTRVHIGIVPCRLGYVYDNSSKVCECAKKDGNLLCEHNNYSYACVRYGYWIGNDTLTDNTPMPCLSSNCYYSDGKCSHNQSCSDNQFCRLSNVSNQCWNRRGGILCSGCSKGNSFTFSALSCVPSQSCHPKNTAFIALGVIFYWIIFVIFVMFILSVNLSVGSGFMYGIVYYFSVLNLFTDSTVSGEYLVTLINTCISTTQLCPRAFGNIGVCFVESWNLNLHHQLFHYVSPAFVVGIVAIIILASRCCRFPKIISLAQNSPIHAICMLVLLSYTSLVYASFNMLKPININGKLQVYIDPEVSYFGKKHIPYALVGLLTELFITLPICFFLLFAPCLSRRLNLVRLRLKPIVDEFQACYRPQCRWFAGFYFLARQIVFLAYAIPPDTLSQSNGFLQLTNGLLLIVHCAFQPYKLKWLNLLDALLLFDILLLSFCSVEWASGFLHKATAYVLILPPCVLLFVIILVILCKRVLYCSRSTKLYKRLSMLRRRSVKETELPSKTHTATYSSVGIDADSASHSKAKPFTGSDFFKDCGEREPLLSETESTYHLRN